MKLAIFIYVLIYLIPASIIDVKCKAMNLFYWGLYLIPLPVLIILNRGSIFEMDRVYGLIIGVLFILISFISSGQLGMGDALIITWLGVSLGAFWLIIALGIAWALCFFVGIVKILKKKRDEIPFIPFLLIGVVASFMF